MSLSSRIKNRLMDAINTASNGIGYSNGTKMPKSTSNTDPIAYELFIAQHLSSLAAKRKEKAELAAVKAGIINDKEKHPKPVGTKEVIYTGDNVIISLEVRQGATRVDADKMFNYLASAGVKTGLLSEAKEAASSVNRAAHVFSAILITNDNGK